jgi:hypothetical protein
MFEGLTQKEFIGLSQDEVLCLNGKSSDESVTEAWRGGYIYLKEKLSTFYNTLEQHEFFEQIENIIEADLNEFED